MTSTPASSGAPAEILPGGRQFAVTWGIPDDFGGMTAALLHRSRAFVRQAGAEVDILTFDDRADYPAVRSALRERGDLIDGIRLRNIYEHFREADRAPVSVAHRPRHPTRPPDEDVGTPYGSVRRWRTEDAEVHTEHRRADGTLAVLDERRRGGRLITSFDRSEHPTGQWQSATSFRFAWLDELFADDPAIVTVDSKAAARFLQKYQRPRVTMIHLVHGAHHDSEGRLTASRRPIFENLHRWDAVVFLTDRQRAAAVELLGDTGNLDVVPNGVTLPDRVPRLPPDRLHGVIVARLVGIKRLEHALRIIAAVRELDIPVTAEIIGEGPRRERLEAEAARLGLSGAVRFAGYVPHAADQYLTASWTLLTSRSEGESLSLVEAMGAGCLPVAYDIRYGPAEIIVDERNGRLVPDGDIGAAARALVGLCLLDDDRLAAMRRAARKTAQGHDDAGTVSRWADVQRRAVERHDQRHDLEGSALERIRVRRLRGRLLVTARVPAAHPLVRVEVRLSRGKTASALTAMRPFGRWRFVRLSRESSARLGNGAVRARFLVHIDDTIAAVDAGVRHPDPRSIVRRVADRLGRARVLSPAEAPAPRGSTRHPR